MPYIAQRQCDRCDAGLECLRNEAGGLRPYESYWHYLKGLPDNQAWVECFKSEDDKVDGLLAEADYHDARVGSPVADQLRGSLESVAYPTYHVIKGEPEPSLNEMMEDSGDE